MECAARPIRVQQDISAPLLRRILQWGRLPAGLIHEQAFHPQQPHNLQCRYRGNPPARAQVHPWVRTGHFCLLRAENEPVCCRETNSIACHGAPGVSNTAGIALWVIDYTLQASTLGIEQAYFHEGVGYKYDFVSLYAIFLLNADSIICDRSSP